MTFADSSIVPFSSRVQRRAAAWYEAYFFAPAHPAGLAICRIMLYGYLMRKVAQGDLSVWASAPAGLWSPIGLLSWLPGPIRSPELLQGFQWLFVAVLACCALGVWYRICASAAPVLAVVCFGLPQCFGKVDHSHTLPVLVLCVLAVANAADALSVQAWLRRRRGQTPPAPCGEYRWPLALAQTLMCFVFFAAGVAKLRSSGLAWAFSDNLQNYLVAGFYTGHGPRTTLGLWLVGHPVLCQMVAGAALLMEVTAPLALVSRRYRWFVIPGLLGMQIGIHLTMGIRFEEFRTCYLVWIPWTALIDRWTGFWSTREPATIAVPTAIRRAA
jgi:hypothetical protein